MLHARTFLTILFCVLFAPVVAHAVTIEGVEFLDPLAFDVPASGSLSISTSADVYVFAPGPVLADVFDITAGLEIIVLQSIDANVVSFCAQSPACETGPFAFDQDVLVRILEPIASLTIRAGGSVVVGTQPIPEPATALLLGMGLGALALARRMAPPTSPSD